MTRRTLASLAAAILSAQSPSPVLVWRLARSLSLAAIAKAHGQPFDSHLQKAQSAASALAVTVPPLPEMSGEKPARLAAAMHYVLQTAGRSLASQLRQKYGTTSVATFECGSKSMLLAALYAPGDSTALAAAQAVERSATTAGFNPAIFQPLLSSVRNAEPNRTVVDHVFALDSKIAAAFPNP